MTFGFRSILYNACRRGPRCNICVIAPSLFTLLLVQCCHCPEKLPWSSVPTVSLVSYHLQFPSAPVTMLVSKAFSRIQMGTLHTRSVVPTPFCTLNDRRS